MGTPSASELTTIKTLGQDAKGDFLQAIGMSAAVVVAAEYLGRVAASSVPESMVSNPDAIHDGITTVGWLITGAIVVAGTVSGLNNTDKWKTARNHLKAKYPNFS